MKEFGLVRVKRDRVPQWLWKFLGQYILHQPLRFILTREPRRDEQLPIQEKKE